MFVYFILFLIEQTLCSYYYHNTSINNISEITCLAITKYKQYLFMGTLEPDGAKLHVYEENLENPQYIFSQKQQLLIGKTAINVLYLSQDCTILLVGTYKDKISYYLLENGKLEYKMAIHDWTGDQNDIDMSLDDNFLVIGNTNGTISVYENRSIQTTQRQVNLNSQQLNAPKGFGGTNLLTNQSEQSRVGSQLPLNYEFIQLIQSPGTSVASLILSHNSSRLYVGYYNKSLIVYALRNYSYHYIFQQQLNDDVISCMQLSEFGKILVTGSRKGIIRIYIGSSQGTQIFLNQILYEPQQQILSIRITKDNLMLFITTLNQNTFIYTRQLQKLNFKYDDQKSQIFINNPKQYVSIKLPQGYFNYTQQRYKKEAKKQKQRLQAQKKQQQIKTNSIGNISQNIENKKDEKDQKQQQKLKKQQTQKKQITSTKIENNQQLPLPVQLTSSQNYPIFSDTEHQKSKELEIKITYISSKQNSDQSTINQTSKTDVVSDLNVSKSNMISQLQKNKNQSHVKVQNRTNKFNVSKPSTDGPRLVPTYLSNDNSLFIQAQGDSLAFFVSCQHTIYKCDKCKNNLVCNGCIMQNYLFYQKCHSCSVGCQHCKNNKVCFKCSKGYYLNISQAICYNCNSTLQNCQSCSKPQQCDMCLDKYFLNSDGKCQQIKQNITDDQLIIQIPTIPVNKTKTELSDTSSQQGRLFVVFLITCIVFVILLIVTGFLLFYVNRITRMQRNRQNNLSEPQQNRNSNRASSERRIVSEINS